LLIECNIDRVTEKWSNHMNIHIQCKRTESAANAYSCRHVQMDLSCYDWQSSSCPSSLSLFVDTCQCPIRVRDCTFVRCCLRRRSVKEKKQLRFTIFHIEEYIKTLRIGVSCWKKSSFTLTTIAFRPAYRPASTRTTLPGFRILPIFGRFYWIIR
jgi:hypothetical protein